MVHVTASIDVEYDDLTSEQAAKAIVAWVRSGRDPVQVGVVRDDASMIQSITWVTINQEGEVDEHEGVPGDADQDGHLLGSG